jgi:hypothetical protein
MIFGKRVWRVILGLLAVTLVTTAAAAPSVISAGGGDEREWQFRVLLDGDEIGYHRFELVDDGDQYRVISEASFTVRFLFFDAYRYEHSNEELWRDGCLQRMEARTEVNGKSLAVLGRRVGDGFVVATGDDESMISDCVMSFAYWTPDFLEQERLLNSQTGEYVPVRIEPVRQERLEIRGEQVDAIRYSLDAGKLDMDLWYSPKREWLGLESTTKGGRLLRYVLL